MNIMAAVVREKSGPFVMEEIQLDEPRADEVVVRVVSAGICHTDLIPREQAIPVPFPAVYGHEGAGVVEKVGSQVAKLKPGDHVVMSFNSCGVCVPCKRGEISYCVDHFASNFGFARFSDKSKTMRKGDEVVHGAFFNQSSFATHALGTERTVVKIPSDVPLEIMGPLGCGIQTGAGAVLNSLHPHAGASIAIFGGGSVGLSALLAAAAVGCTKIILVDVSDERLKLGTELGATHTVNGAILDDADVDEAVNAAVFGSFLYQGQICMSTERIVVDDTVADEFVRKFAARAKELKCGDPGAGAGDCVVGPMVNASSGPRINAMIDDAVAKGAKVVAGGKADGAVMPATVVDGVTPDMEIFDAETFGPITTVVRAKGTDDAVRLANETEYGLSAGVFGRDTHRALQVAMRIDCGSVHVNGSTVQNEAQAPYGGMKNSGYGRFDGRAVIDEFTELKWITIEPLKQQYPI